MNCREARQYINLFLDSELDSKTNLEISEHLSSCEECNTRFAQEERLEKSLVSVLKEDKVPKAEVTWEGVISRFSHQVEWEEEKHLSFRPFLWRYLVPATATVIGLVIMLIMYSRQDTNALAAAAQKCHIEYMTDKIAPSLESMFPDEVSGYLSDKYPDTSSGNIDSRDGAILSVIYSI